MGALRNALYLVPVTVIAGAGLSGGCDTGGPAGRGAGGAGDAGSVCGAAPSGPLPEDATGWVPAGSNPYCIQGEWTFLIDSQGGGKSTFTGLVSGVPPYVAGSGMCLSGSTPGGAADGYKTWGGTVALDLSQAAPGSTPLPLASAPPCFTITLTGSGAPGGLTAGLCPPSSGGSVVCPQVTVGVGKNEVCIEDVATPSWCKPGSGQTCLAASQLAQGIQSVQVEGNAGMTGGPIDFCVAGIVPHDRPAPDGGSSDGGDLPVIVPGQTDPQAFGTRDVSGIAFAGLSTVQAHEQDPQVLELVPDLLPRAWVRWDTNGLNAFDYDFTYPAACKAKGITFMGGTTVSALFQDEVSGADFLDQVSRDAAGAPVKHPELGPTGYRGSLASPAFRQRMVDIGKIQIDGGVDGVHLDEVLGSYTGASYFGGDEGFDDHGVADFGAFLCAKYAGSPAKLTGLGVTAADHLDCTGAGAGRGFDYRGYLARHGAQTSPLDGSVNPLAPDWGPALFNNRAIPPAGTFLSTYPAFVYFQQIVVALRTYARQRYNREILLSANGVFPFVDLQSIALYSPNNDGPGGSSIDWVPVVTQGVDGGTTLDGSVSFKPALQAFKAMSKGVVTAAGPGAKEVPIVLFLDSGTASMARYFALPLQGKIDYFRLFAAEAYALGMWFAVPLASTTDTNTATKDGTMSFFGQLRSFYGEHADVYRGAQELPDTPTVSAPNVTTILNRLPDGRTALHLVNHAYSGGVVSQQGVTASFPLAAAPSSVKLISPDFTADQTATFMYTGGTLDVTVGKLDAYVAVVVQ